RENPYIFTKDRASALQGFCFFRITNLLFFNLFYLTIYKTDGLLYKIDCGKNITVNYSNFMRVLGVSHWVWRVSLSLKHV
ncbi:hypothetical protein, partial [Yersinia pestis]|uniref:hypothetical protein n=1 Tax=Yersinia pestis TaxID=632 RepID=UPI001ED99308